MTRDGITVGIDIGTSSVKAVAADPEGNVVARARIPHAFSVPSPLRFEHDARKAWFEGPRAALAALGSPAELDPVGVSVAAMVPSLTAVDDDGVPCSPGLLYGDERGYTGATGNPAETGELTAFLRWTAKQRPDARGYWPAQAVANFAIAGEAVISTTTAALALPLFDWTGWDPALTAEAGARLDQMPAIVPSGQPAGKVAGYRDAVLEAGIIDALAEQIVAGADSEGDIIVICGTTLIVWVVVREPLDVPGFYCVPHTTPGFYLVGGPSNAGGLFLDWAAGLLAADGGRPLDAHDLPFWVPYPRGERVPLADPARRAELRGLDLTHGPAALRRATFEAAGFVTRRMVEAVAEAGGPGARRLVALGGGVRVAEWIQALADCTGLPVDLAAVPEGGALGTAFLARMAAGLEGAMHEASRWARTARRVEPDPPWAVAAGERYAGFLAAAG